MLHTRQQLITWLEHNITDPILSDALEWGRIINLGGFDPLPTSKNPGWIMKLVSRYGRTFYLAVAVDKKSWELYWFRLKEVDWTNWVGENATNKLYRGDEKK